MATPQPDSDTPHRIEFFFDRRKCIGWALFSLVVATACGVVAIVASSEPFFGGLITGRLFGVAGGLLFLSVGASWGARALHGGPALVIDEDGVKGSSLLGGLFGSGVGDGLDWSEIAGAEAGSHGSIIIPLTDPETFWARQGIVARIVGWNPFRKGWLGVGGNDLRADRADVLALLRHQAVADERAGPDKQIG